MNKRLKQVLQTILFLLIGLALVYFQIKGLAPSEKQAVVSSVRKAKLFWLFAAMTVAVFSHFLRAIRWKMLIKSSHENVRTSNAFYAVMIGYLANGFVPRLGEVLRCGVLGRKEHIKVEKLIGTVIIERLVDITLMFIVVGITLLVQYKLLFNFLNNKLFQPFMNNFASSLPQLAQTLLIAVVVLILFIALLLFLFQQFGLRDKLSSMKSSFMEGITSLQHLNNKPLFFAYSIAMWVCYFFMAYLVFFSLDESKHLGVNAGLTVLTTGSLALIIPTPGGLGAYHQFVSNSLHLYDISHITGISLSWLIWASNFTMILAVGLVSLLLISMNQNKQ